MSVARIKFQILILAVFIPWAFFAASQTFLPQGPAPLNGPILITPPGPSLNQTGAIQAVAVNPGNSQNLYIASASGGVWSTNDFGTTWTPLLDHQLNLSMASIAFDLTDSSYKTLVA